MSDTEISDFKVKEWDINKLRDRKIWIPNMCDSAYILSAVLRGKGYDSDVLPSSKDPLFSLGRKYTDGDQCLPSVITTEDILQRVFSSDFKEDKEAFFQGKSDGPCRFGRYYMNQLGILFDLGKDNIPIFTLDSKNAYNGMGSDFKTMAWDGLVGQAMIERCLYFTRPFEVNSGESKFVYDYYLKKICDVLSQPKSKGDLSRKIDIALNRHKPELTSVLQSATEYFSRIKKRDEKKPIVYVTGEIYVRSSNVANQNLIDKIEGLGGVALLEPTISFFSYTNEIKFREKREKSSRRIKDLKELLKSYIDILVSVRDEKDISKIFEKYLGDFAHEPSAEEIINLGTQYIHEKYHGEAIVSLGSSDYFSRKVNGIINTLPFNCMPGLVVSSKTNELRAKNNNISFLNLAYDGHFDPNRDEQLSVFMHHIKQRM